MSISTSGAVKMSLNLGIKEIGTSLLVHLSFCRRMKLDVFLSFFIYFFFFLHWDSATRSTKGHRSKHEYCHTRAFVSPSLCRCNMYTHLYLYIYLYIYILIYTFFYYWCCGSSFLSCADKRTHTHAQVRYNKWVTTQRSAMKFGVRRPRSKVSAQSEIGRAWNVRSSCAAEETAWAGCASEETRDLAGCG